MLQINKKNKNKNNNLEVTNERLEGHRYKGQ